MDSEESMPDPVTRKRLKDRILESVAKAVKKIQAQQLYSSRRSGNIVLTNSDPGFHRLVEHLDHALLHGLRHISNGYWVLVREFTHKSTVKQIKLMQNVTTNLGRGRAWMYLALSDHLLESYLHCFMSNIKLVRKFYLKEAIALDQQRMQILLTLSSGLEQIDFDLEVDLPYLDLCSHMRRSSQVDEDSIEQRSPRGQDQHYVTAPWLHEESGLHPEGLVFHGRSADEPLKVSPSLPSLYDAAKTHRIARSHSLEQHSLNNIESCGTSSDNLEVIRVKPKQCKSKKRAVNKKRNSDAEKVSIASSEVSVASDPPTPESGYRSVLCNSAYGDLERSQELSLADNSVTLNNVNEDEALSEDSVLIKTDCEVNGEMPCVVSAEVTCNTAPCEVTSEPKADVTQIVSLSTSQILMWNTACDDHGDVKLEADEPTGTSLTGSVPVSPTDESCVTRDVSPDISPQCDPIHYNIPTENPRESASSYEEESIYDKRKSLCEEASVCSSHDDDEGDDDDDVPIDCDVNEVNDKTVEVSCREMVCRVEGSHDDTVNLLTLTGPVAEERSNEEGRSLEEEGQAAKHPAESVVDINTKLLLMLEVFQYEEETFQKMFETSMGHTEGDKQAVYLLITNMALYILTTMYARAKFNVEARVHFAELDFISLGLHYQVINIICTNRRKKFWITTGDKQLTKCIVGCLDDALRLSHLNNVSRLSVLTDATTEKIAMKKWLVQDCQTNREEASVVSYSLVHWEDMAAVKPGIVHMSQSKEGLLSYKAYDSYMWGPVWKTGYFVLKHGTLYQYTDPHDNSQPVSTIPLNYDECVGCRRSRDSDKAWAFEVVQSETNKLLLCAASEEETREWMQSLCQAVSDDMGCPVSSSGCLACCCVLTNDQLILCHEDIQTNFFRTLASVKVTQISRLLIDPGAKTYCVLIMERSEEGSSEEWGLYFTTNSSERDTFISALRKAWSHHYQVTLTSEYIEEVRLQARCREMAVKLKLLGRP